MPELTIRKHPLTRVAHYIFLLPFLPALQPLLVHYRKADVVIYLAGIVLVLFLIVYGNHLPLLKTTQNGLNIFLHYRHNAEYHSFKGLRNYKSLKGNRIILYSTDHRPVVLRMKKKDIENLIAVLKEENIHEINK